MCKKSKSTYLFIFTIRNHHYLTHLRAFNICVYYFHLVCEQVGADFGKVEETGASSVYLSQESHYSINMIRAVTVEFDIPLLYSGRGVFQKGLSLRNIELVEFLF